MGAIFGGKPDLGTSMPEDTSKQEAEARKKERMRVNAAGRSSLLATGGAGLTNQANTQQSLLRSGLKSKLGE